MAYLLNAVDLLTVYGIIPSHSEGSNISLRGCFDMPKRSGICYYEWGDDDSVDPLVSSSDIAFEGRDITFSGFISGTRASAITNLNTFYTAIKAFTGQVVFSTPYGDFTGYVKSITPKHYSNGTSIEMVFREPIVTMAEVDMPAGGTVDEEGYIMTMASLGLYPKEFKDATNLPELKEQFVTMFGTEGAQAVKRKVRTIDFYATLMGSSIADFIAKVKVLYYIFSSPGTHGINISNDVSEYVFAVEGFSVKNVIASDVVTIGNFNIKLIVADAYIAAATADEHITADDTTVTVDSTLITADNV